MIRQDEIITTLRRAKKRIMMPTELQWNCRGCSQTSLKAARQSRHCSCVRPVSWVSFFMPSTDSNGMTRCHNKYAAGVVDLVSPNGFHYISVVFVDWSQRLRNHTDLWNRVHGFFRDYLLLVEFLNGHKHSHLIFTASGVWLDDLHLQDLAHLITVAGRTDVHSSISDVHVRVASGICFIAQSALYNISLSINLVLSAPVLEESKLEDVKDNEKKASLIVNNELDYRWQKRRNKINTKRVTIAGMNCR